MRRAGQDRAPWAEVEDKVLRINHITGSLQKLDVLIKPPRLPTSLRQCIGVGHICNY